MEAIERLHPELSPRVRDLRATLVRMSLESHKSHESHQRQLHRTSHLSQRKLPAGITCLSFK